MPKLIRITTVPMALRYLLPGQMRFMKENGFDVLMISADGKEVKDVVSNELSRHVIVPFTRKITPFQDLACLVKLIRIIRKEKPDIVHTHTPKAGLLGMMAAKICNVKVRIHTVAGLPLMVEKGFKFRLLKFAEECTYKAANQVWPNSNSLLNFIAKHKMTDPSKLKLIGKGSTNGIDTDFFSRDSLDGKIIDRIKNNIRYSPESKYLLFTGRLVVDKGVPELLHVFKKMLKENMLVKLILLGEYETELDPLPADVIYEIENNSSVIHIKWTDEVKYYMFLSDVFIFPSHREGFPNVLLQAGAMELPIICSRIEGNVDIVTHFETGLVFNRGNETEILDLIKYALDNKDKVREMSKKLRDEIRVNYRMENIWHNILVEYKSLVN